MKVLVVDPDPATRRLVQRIVRRDMQGNVVEAESAFDALDLLEKERFDVALVSLELAGMTGVRLLEVMRAAPKTAAIPVLMLTTSGDEMTIRTLARLGVAGVLAKPVDESLMSRRLQRFADSMQAGSFHAYNNDPATGNDCILVIDGDSHFRHFALDALRGGRKILQASTGAAGVKAALVHRPSLAIIGQNIGLLDGTLLVRELRGTPLLRSMRILKLSSDGSEAVVPEGFDGLLPRTFVPENFRKALTALTGTQGPWARFVALYPGWLKDVSTGVDQVCGMMLGFEMKVVKSEAAIAAQVVRSVQVVTAVDRGLSLRFEIEASLEHARQATAAMAGLEPGEVTEEDACATMAELANIVTGRLRSALGEAGIVLNCSLPTTQTAERGLPVDANEQQQHLHFVSADGSMALHVVLEAGTTVEELTSVA